jgi:hypothetical protein
VNRFPIVLSVLVSLSVCTVPSITSANETWHAKPAAAPLKVAPADEYFGRLKMSILGIANTIKDQSAMYDRRPDQLQSEMHAMVFVVDAIRDWEHKYPRDPWIAKSLFNLERFYNKIPTADGRAEAMRTMVWLVHDFPATWYGRVGREEIAGGKVGAVIAQDPPIPAPQPTQ